MAQSTARRFDSPPGSPTGRRELGSPNLKKPGSPTGRAQDGPKRVALHTGMQAAAQMEAIPTRQVAGDWRLEEDKRQALLEEKRNVGQIRKIYDKVREARANDDETAANVDGGSENAEADKRGKTFFNIASSVVKGAGAVMRQTMFLGLLKDSAKIAEFRAKVWDVVKNIIEIRENLVDALFGFIEEESKEENYSKWPPAVQETIEELRGETRGLHKDQHAVAEEMEKLKELGGKKTAKARMLLRKNPEAITECARDTLSKVVALRKRYDKLRENLTGIGCGAGSKRPDVEDDANEQVMPQADEAHDAMLQYEKEILGILHAHDIVDTSSDDSDSSKENAKGAIIRGAPSPERSRSKTAEEEKGSSGVDSQPMVETMKVAKVLEKMEKSRTSRNSNQNGTAVPTLSIGLMDFSGMGSGAASSNTPSITLGTFGVTHGPGGSVAKNLTFSPGGSSIPQNIHRGSDHGGENSASVPGGNMSLIVSSGNTGSGPGSITLSAGLGIQGGGMAGTLSKDSQSRTSDFKFTSSLSGLAEHSVVNDDDAGAGHVIDEGEEIDDEDDDDDDDSDDEDDKSSDTFEQGFDVFGGTRYSKDSSPQPVRRKIVLKLNTRQLVAALKCGVLEQSKTPLSGLPVRTDGDYVKDLVLTPANWHGGVPDSIADKMSEPLADIDLLQVFISSILIPPACTCRNCMNKDVRNRGQRKAKGLSTGSPSCFKLGAQGHQEVFAAQETLERLCPHQTLLVQTEVEVKGAGVELLERTPQNALESLPLHLQKPTAKTESYERFVGLRMPKGARRFQFFTRPEPPLLRTQNRGRRKDESNQTFPSVQPPSISNGNRLCVVATPTNSLVKCLDSGNEPSVRCSNGQRRRLSVHLWSWHDTKKRAVANRAGTPPRERDSIIDTSSLTKAIKQKQKSEVLASKQSKHITFPGVHPSSRPSTVPEKSTRASKFVAETASMWLSQAPVGGPPPGNVMPVMGQTVMAPTETPRAAVVPISILGPGRPGGWGRVGKEGLFTD